jgi:hypothetical protein
LDRQVYQRLSRTQTLLRGLRGRIVAIDAPFTYDEQIDYEKALQYIDALLAQVHAVTDKNVGEQVCAVCGKASTLSVNVCPEHAGIAAATTVG